MIDYVLLEEYAQDITLLFVEDDEIIRKEVYDLLSDIFHHVDVAVDGEDGITQYDAYYKKNNAYYDLVITDIKMPKVNGIELTQMIYERQEEQPLIVLSAHDESKYLIELINMGISQFIQKPLDINNFVQIIFKISKDIHEKKHQLQKAQSHEVRLNDVTIWDKNTKQIHMNNEVIKLSKKELLILDCLLQVEDKICTVDEIISYVWKDELHATPDVQNLNNIIARLRKKLPNVHLENIYGLGYKVNLP